MSDGLLAVIEFFGFVFWFGAVLVLIIWWIESLWVGRHVISPLLIALVTGAPVYFGVNASAPMDTKPFNGYVYMKTYTEGHSETFMAGKVITTQYVPPRWNFIVNAFNGADQRSCDVTEQTYETVNLGQEFHCGGY